MTLHRMLLLVVAVLFGWAGCHSLPSGVLSPHLKSPTRLLFVGNSFTFYNGGLENHVRKLAESLNPGVVIQSDSATKGGATLKILQGLEKVHERIRNGGYDVVILQEDIPELKEHAMAPFVEHAQLFDREIRAAGAKPVLFMAWPYERLNWVTLEQIEQAHREIGRQLGIVVGPVGRALRHAMEARPSLAMLGPDKEHETLHGTYLAANVLYAVVFGRNPTGAAYCPDGITPEEARFLQQIAWKTVLDWRAQ